MPIYYFVTPTSRDLYVRVCVCDGRCPECRGNSSLFQCATGLCIDLMHKLQEDMQFDYEMFQSRDNNWGNYVDEKVGD